MGKQFSCDLCGGTFESGWSDEDAEAEAKELWGHLPPEERAVLCDDCFQKMSKWARDEGLLR